MIRFLHRLMRSGRWILFAIVLFPTAFLQAQVTDTILNKVSDKPFYFSVPVKDGNYRVTVTLGAKDKASKTVVRAESRRLMVENCTTKKGQFETHTFLVNKRSAEIAKGKKVSLKPRELDYLNWDNLLTLEFNGSAPAVQSIRIEPDTTVTTIFLCGNSTVVDQEAEPYASWGQMIPRWFTDKVAISNHAESGLTARTFIAGHRLEKVLTMLKKGDYVICEFGHNDQKEHQPGDGAWYHFQYQLKQFVDQVRKAGGNLIFVTPTQRRRFDDATHTKIMETHDDYPDAMRDVAKREEVPVIELHDMTRDFFETLGYEDSKKALVHYPANTFPRQEKALEDNTHFNPYGAYEVAKMVVMGMKQLGLPFVQHLRKDWQDFDPFHPDNPETFQWYPANRQDATRPDGDTEKSVEQPTSSVPKVTWDQQSLIIDGRRVVPAMGEVHYSRIPAPEWERAVRQMKEGGITMLACYVFWNHIEEIEGQFDWSEQRSLRRFLEVCKAEEMPVVLRIGPYCHGEVRGGGIPDWVVKTGCKLRSQDKVFLGLVEKLYRQIFTQVQGMQWKDGGPVIAAQFDNEYGGDGAYLMTLKGMAKNIGFDLPFYTFTGWPGLRKPVPYGEMLPLYGDYADGFWDRGIEEGCGKYYKAFNFRETRTTGAIASEQIDYSKLSTPNSQLTYPYFTCELGGGMMTSYHRRIYTYPEDAYAMAVVKLGSNSNLLGYYMYHGGTNPEGKLGVTLNEQQRTLSTNWNDLPAMTYDFQAPLNEFGQRNPHFYMLRKLHLFMQDYGEVLAPMTATYPCEQDIKQGDDSHLRWSYRSNSKFKIQNSKLLQSAFVFINNYERFANLTAKENVQFDVCGVKFPQKPITIPASTSCIFPVNIDGIRYATAQLIAHRDGKIYLEQIPGVPTEIAIDGKMLRNLKAYGPTKPVYKNIYLLTSEQAGHLFLEEKAHVDVAYVPPVVKKIREAGTPRQITIGVAKVAEEPVDADFEQAAVYQIALPSDSSLYTPHSSLLEIKYRGDVARLYANGRLIDDNFYNGRPFQYALWRLPKGCRQLELRILPIQKDMPVYFPREADFQTPGEEVKSVTIQPLHQ